MLAQLKFVFDSASVRIPHASFDPLFTAAGVVVPAPRVFSCTVTFRQIAIGATISRIVTVAAQVEELLLLSVTVSVTELGFVEILEQLNAVCESERERIPQASLDPLLTEAAVVVPEPRLFNCTVTFWQIAIGTTLS